MFALKEQVKQILPEPLIKVLRKAKKSSIIPLRVTDIILNKLSSSPEFSLNIGGGNWFKRGWKNVDFYAEPIFVDFKVNLLQDQILPIEDNRVKKVFCSHLIEHISDQNAIVLIAEVYRVMKPGSILRICCPDADKALNAFLKKDMSFFDLPEVLTVGDNIGKRLVMFFASYDDAEGNFGEAPVNETEVREKVESISKDELIKWCVSLIPKEATYVAHINGYDFEKMKQLLENTGFVKIEKSSYRNSKDIEFHGEGFDNRPNHSLYVECYKPTEVIKSPSVSKISYY